MELGDGATPPVERRLPSTRSIDQRWDRSRGIIFSNALTNGNADHTWSCNDRIVFGQTAASRRGYANRNLFAPKPPGQKGDRGPAQGSVLDAHKPISASDFGGGHLLDDLKREQNAHKATKLHSERDMEELRRTHAVDVDKVRAEQVAEVHRMQEEKAKEIAGIRAVADKQERQLADQLQALHDERKALEDERREEKRKSAERDQTLKNSEDDLRARLAQLETTIAQAQHDAKQTADRNVARLVQSAVKREKEADADAKDYQRQIYQTIDRLTKEYSNDLQEHKSALDQANEEELREIRKAGIYRANVERADYEAYHRFWDEVGNSSREYLSGVVKIYGALFIKAERWKDIAESFDGAKIHPWFPHRYPKLNQRLQEYLHTAAQEAMNAAQALKDGRKSTADAMDALSRHAHVSRMLTRYHHFEARTNEYQTATLVSNMLNEQPLRHSQETLQHQIDEIKQQVENPTNQAVKDSLQQKRSKIAALLTFFVHLREVEGLEALLRDTIAEKAIFLITNKARTLQEKARKNWSMYTTENPSTAQDSEVSVEQQRRDRNEWIQKYNVARVEQDDLMDLMRKRRVLEIHLGETKDSEGEYNAAIDQKLVQAKSAMEGALDRVLRSGSSSGRVRYSMPVRPVPAVPTPSTSQMSQDDCERAVHEIKAKLKNPKAYATEQEKQKDERALEKLKLERNKRQIINLTAKRAAVLRKSPPDHAAAVRLQKSLEQSKNALARAEDEVERLEKDGETETGDTRANTTKSSVPEVERNIETKIRYSSPIIHRRQKRRGTKASVRSDSAEHLKHAAATSEGNEAKPAGGTLSFKPTPPQNAPCPRWSSGVRSLHAGNSLSNAAYPASRGPASRDSDGFFEDPVSLSQALGQLSVESARADDNNYRHVEEDANLSSIAAENTPFGLTLEFDDSDWISEDGAESDRDLSSSYSSDQFAELKAASEPVTTMGAEPSIQNRLDADQVEVAEGNIPLTYNMSPKDYRDAVIASTSTSAAFWTFKLYKNADGKPPKALYCTNYEQTEARAKDFLNEPVIGFDIEWEPWATLAKSPPKQNISLIQIAAEDKIGLFHLAMFNGDTPDKLLPPSLRVILESRHIAKVGVNVAGDSNRVKKCLDVDMEGLFELSHLYRVVELSKSTPGQVNKRLVGLAEQVQKVLGLPLKKDEVRTSAWSKKLQLEQTDYAATDAYAGFRLYHELEARRKKMDPMPPRPAFWEEHKPIQLGDGKLIVPKPYVAKRKREVSENVGRVVEEDDDDDACEEYFEAVESLDVDSSPEESSQSSGSNSDDSQLYTSAPEGSQESVNENQELSQSQRAQAPEQFSSNSHQGAAHSAHPKTNHPPPSPEVTRAEHWVTNWRASLPANYNLQVTTPTLRAYHMWHEQKLDCPTVAALLRHPPLSLQTVASYVMAALQEEDLPFDAKRVREPLEILPKSVHGRYRRILERISQGG